MTHFLWIKGLKIHPSRISLDCHDFRIIQIIGASNCPGHQSKKYFFLDKNLSSHIRFQWTTICSHCSQQKDFSVCSFEAEFLFTPSITNITFPLEIKKMGLIQSKVFRFFFSSLFFFKI